MSDEALLIGKVATEADEAQAIQETTGANGRSGIKVPTEIVNVSLFAVYKELAVDGSEVFLEQKNTVNLPRNIPADDIADFLWNRVLQRGAFKVTGSGGEINYYPLELFKRYTTKVGTVVGVTL